MRHKLQKKTLWLQWTIATILSAFTFGGLSWSWTRLPFLATPFIIIIIIITFLSWGVSQWVILRQRIPGTFFWIPATGIGNFLGLFVVFSIGRSDILTKYGVESSRMFWEYQFPDNDYYSITSGFFLGAFIGGAIVGFLQCLILLYSCRRAFWWTFASGLGWMASVSWLSFYWMKARHTEGHTWENFGYLVLASAIAGIIKGIVLNWILAPLESRKHTYPEIRN